MKKEILCMASGAMGSFITQLFGVWSPNLTIVMIFMLADLLTGFIAAAVFHTSPKTETGAAESNAMFKGLVRKFVMIIIIAMAHQLDIVIDVNYIMTAVIYSFMVNELLSIVENAGLMGIVKNQVLINAIDILKKKKNDVEK